MNSTPPTKTDTISSNTLFHFTNSAAHLISILTDEFRPKYCLEDFSFLYQDNPQKLEFAFPIVCFCDLPLSQIKTHLRLYGSYGIGMSKDWGKTNGVSPVLYSHRQSSFLAHLNRIISESIAEDDRISKEGANPSFKNYRRIFGLLSFLKPYEGDLWRRDHYINSVRFYDEREWRYVPETLLHSPQHDTRELLELKEYLSSEEFFNQITLEDNNRQIGSDTFKIKFEPKDIKYIIVSREQEILPMIKSIRRIKDKYSPDQVDVLASRIISANQIIEDF